MAPTNELASMLKSLHQRVGRPLVLVNVFDRLSARAVADLPQSEALATASYAVAQAAGVADDDLSLDINLAAVQHVAAVAREYRKPLTVDLQDGYGRRLEEAISKLIDLGVVGINLEDSDKESGKMKTREDASDRIRRVLEATRKRGVPDFVINARCDALLHGEDLNEVIARGKSYLEAGATTVFVWGASRGVSKQEVETMVEEFGGRLNVLLKTAPDGLSIKELAQIGVARISVGPTLQIRAMATYKQEAEKLFNQL